MSSRSFDLRRTRLFFSLSASASGLTTFIIRSSSDILTASLRLTDGHAEYLRVRRRSQYFQDGASLHPVQGVLGYGVERGALPRAAPGVWSIAIQRQRRRHKGMGYGVRGMGYGVQPSVRARWPEGTIFPRGALRTRVIVRIFFGACGGQSHLLGSTNDIGVWGMGYGVWEAPRTARGTGMAVLRWCRKPSM